MMARRCRIRFSSSRGYAIHGSYEVKHLGRPASHGCIRLHPSNAAALYSLVQRYGTGNTLIKITY